MNTIWDTVKEAVRGNLPEKTFALWIRPITLMEQQSDTLVLGCPNKFSMNWITENYIDIMQERLDDISDGSCKLLLKVMPPERNSGPYSDPLQGNQMLLPHVHRKPARGLRTLNDDFTFDRFVVGKCNELAYSASKALALESSFSYNPLFILANTGLGKSHLSQAVGHTLIQNNPALRVYYVTAEDFVNEMISALRNSQIEQFKEKYRRSCDALLLEEVHFLSGKEKTQLELAYTLDALSNDHKRIIFTSSMLPKDIPNLNKELSSRLTSGLITILDRPDYETRLKILERKSSEQKLPLSEDIIHLLAENLIGDIRQMESALRCLRAKSEFMKVSINLDLAKDVLRSHMPEEAGITIEDIQTLVCQYFKVDQSALQSKSRKNIHAYPRNVYVYLCRQYTGSTIEDIGRSINRNHSTVLYACATVERKMKQDAGVKNQVTFLGERLKNTTP